MASDTNAEDGAVLGALAASMPAMLEETQ